MRYCPPKYWEKRGKTYPNEFEKLGLKRTILFKIQKFIFKKQIKKLSPTQLLDIGCGFGRLFNIYQKYSHNFVGIDISLSMLMHAKNRKKSFKGCSLIRGTVTSLPFKENAFDLVLTTEVLLHVPPKEIENALLEISRVAKEFVLNLEFFQKKRPKQLFPHNFLHDYPGIYKKIGLKCIQTTKIPLNNQFIFICQKDFSKKL